MLPSSELLAQRPLCPGQWQKAKPEILSVCPMSSPAATARNGHGETHPEPPKHPAPKNPRLPRALPGLPVMGRPRSPPCTERGTGEGCDGTVKRGRGGGGDIQQADAVPRREAEEAAIAAGVAAAAAVPVGGGGQGPHPHPRPRSHSRLGPVRHRPGSPRAAPRAPGAAAERPARRRKMSQTAPLPVRPPWALSESEAGKMAACWALSAGEAEGTRRWFGRVSLRGGQRVDRRDGAALV